MNLVEPILRYARLQPHHPALIEPATNLTYRELADRVTRMATALSRQGVGSGDQVGLCLKDDAQHVVALLAIIYLGAIAVQIDARFRRAERDLILKAFPLRLLVATSDIGVVASHPIVTVEVASRCADAMVHPAPPMSQNWHAPLLALSSSGTTGLPKFTLATHLQYYFHLASYLEAMPPSRHRYLSTLPLCFSAGRVGCLAHLLRGDTVVLYPTLCSAEEFVAAISHYKITAAFVVPTTLRQILSLKNNESPALGAIDLLMSAGAPLFAEEKEEIRRKITPRFCELYGAAAIGPIAALRPEEVELRPSSVGRPFSFIDVAIVDDEGRPVDAGATGHLRCRGPGLTSPIPLPGQEATSDFRDGWYHPGELGTIDEFGYISLRGRTTEVIYRGGGKIFPAEIEAVLQAHHGVAESAVVGRLLPNNEQEVIAYVVTNYPLDAGELYAHCRTWLTGFKVPREIRIVTEFPRRSSGKIDRRLLTD